MLRLSYFYCSVNKLLAHCQMYSSSAVGNSTNNSNTSQQGHQMVTFMEKSSVKVSKIIEDLSAPFVTFEKMKDVFLNFYPDKFERTNSAVYDFYAHGHIHKPAVDYDYIVNNPKEIQENIKARKTKAIKLSNIVESLNKLPKLDAEIEKYKDNCEKLRMKQKEGLAESELQQQFNFDRNILMFLRALRKEMVKYSLVNALYIPNSTSPQTPTVEKGKKVLATIGSKINFDFEPRDHVKIARKLKILRQSYMSRIAGHRNCFLLGAGAELEQALVQFALDEMRQRGFQFLSVPNILKDVVFDGAGLVSREQSHMIYNIDNASSPGFSLAGTSELGILAYLSSHCAKFEDLPLKICSVSTCYRRETATQLDRAGLFRIHQFWKVEMFGVTANETGNESKMLHEEFVEIQTEIYDKLGLHFNVVDMPINDLGLPAHRKVDIEAWMPGRGSYSEISSASNCTDYQSRRLHILYKKENEYKFAHTTNATALATPRIIVALLENGQTDNLKIKLPSCLHQYMKGKTTLMKEPQKALEYIGPERSKATQVILT